MVRKVERQYLDVSGPNPDPLRINSSSVDAYFRNFVWDNAHFQHQGKQLSELVSLILTTAQKADDELKKLATGYNEKQVALTALQRKKVINLATSDFEDFLSNEAAARLEITHAGSDGILETVFVVLPKSFEQGAYMGISVFSYSVI